MCGDPGLANTYEYNVIADCGVGNHMKLYTLHLAQASEYRLTHVSIEIFKHISAVFIRRNGRRAVCLKTTQVRLIIDYLVGTLNHI